MSMPVAAESVVEPLPTACHRSACELEEFRRVLADVPRDEGTVQLVVARPAEGERTVLSVGLLDRETGLVGDTWMHRPSNRTADGGPHPRMQLNVMSYPMAAFLAIDESRVPLAGDQLYLDLDLSHDNLPVGTQLLFGAPGLPGQRDRGHRGAAYGMREVCRPLRSGGDALRQWPDRPAAAAARPQRRRGPAR